MEEYRFLAFDIGSENGRAAVGILKDNLLILDELLSFKTSVLKIGKQYKWNVYSYFEQILTALRLYSDKYSGELSAVGIDTWGFDFGVLDDRGQLISLPNHPRELDLSLSEGILDERFGNRRIYELTGMPRTPSCTATQLIDLVRRGDIIAKHGRRLLFIGDILNYFLTGSGACELSVAKTSGLIDLDTNSWSDEIFDVFEIPEAFKSDIILPATKVGTINGNVLQSCGLKTPVPVIVPVSLNLLSASVAIPHTDNSTLAYISSGARGICGIETDKPVLNGLTYEYNLANLPSIFNKNLLLKQSKGSGLIRACIKDWSMKGRKYTYEDIIDSAFYAQPFSGVIDVDNPMFDNPPSMPEAISSFAERTGQGYIASDNIGVISRILFESLAFKYRYYFEQIKKTTFKTFNTLHIVGGGCRNVLLNQFCANLLDVQVVSGPVEASAIGNILVQACGLKIFNSIEEIRSCVANSFAVSTYYPEHNHIWNERYANFLQVCGLKS